VSTDAGDAPRGVGTLMTPSGCAQQLPGWISTVTTFPDNRRYDK